MSLFSASAILGPFRLPVAYWAFFAKLLSKLVRHAPSSTLEKRLLRVMQCPLSRRWCPGTRDHCFVWGDSQTWQFDYVTMDERRTFMVTMQYLGLLTTIETGKNECKGQTVQSKPVRQWRRFEIFLDRTITRFWTQLGVLSEVCLIKVVKHRAFRFKSLGCPLQ